VTIYWENKDKGAEIEVLDCQAEGIDWKGLEKRIESFNPDIVAPSALATCTRICNSDSRNREESEPTDNYHRGRSAFHRIG
jgi:hypothetical protein